MATKKLEPVAVAFVHKELAHDSQLTEEIDDATTALVQPYASYSKDEMPSMGDVFLAPNVDVDSMSGALTGYVATVMGSAPASGVITNALGTGTTWFRVNKDKRRIEDDDLEREFKPIETLPSGVHISVVTGLEYPRIVHYVVAHGNDNVAAQAFADKVASSGASLDDITAGALSDGYNDVINRSLEVRRRAITEFLSAHKLAYDEATSESNMLSNFVVRSDALSEKAHSALVGPKNVHLVYAGVADPLESHSGIMMYRGPIAGYSLFAGPTKTVKARASVAWSNADSVERPFSMFPVDTGRFLGKQTGRTEDRHKDSSATIKDLHRRRVKTSGAVRSYNPLGEVAMHAPNDAHFIATLTALGAPPGGKVTQQHFDAVVTQVPALETRDMSLEELVFVANNAKETLLPVETNSFIRMLANWPAAGQQKLSEVFAKQQDDAVNVDVNLLRSMAKHAASQVEVAKEPVSEDFAE